jgi:hypothetical protein
MFMFPVTHQHHEAWAQLRTGHHDICISFSDTAATEKTTNVTPNAPTVPTTATVRTNSRLLGFQLQFQHIRTQLSTISINAHQFFPDRSGAR